MSYPRTRSMNGDLAEGLTDGKYKKVVNDRGGVVEGTTQNARHDLHDIYFGIHETPVKIAPDGLSHPTPNYVPTAEVR